MKLKILFIIMLTLIFASCKQEKKSTINPIVALFSNTTIVANKTYKKVDGISLKLDVFVPSKRLGEPPWVKYTDGKKPVLLYFHGGGWRSGNKESRILEIMPYADKGWVVVTANYRLLHQATLTEVIEDCHSALNWVVANADKYKIDTNKMVISGNSAGGHLALITGFKRGKEIPKVAAIINWYGISDVGLFVDKWKDKHILVENLIDLEDVYKKTSPINYIENTTPPVLTIHGAIDKIVPYKHATLLHDKLNKFGVKNKLITIKNRKHGDFNAQEMTDAYKNIWTFLAEKGI